MNKVNVGEIKRYMIRELRLDKGVIITDGNIDTTYLAELASDKFDLYEKGLKVTPEVIELAELVSSEFEK